MFWPQKLYRFGGFSSTFCVQTDTSDHVSSIYLFHAETEAQNRERRILRDQERIREGLVVSNGYLQESANRLAADLDRRVR